MPYVLKKFMIEVAQRGGHRPERKYTCVNSFVTKSYDKSHKDLAKTSKGKIMSYFKSKEGSLESSINEVSKHLKDNAYSQFFKNNLKNWQVLLQCLTKEKDFFNKVDKEYVQNRIRRDNGQSLKRHTYQKKTPVITEPKINYNK